MVESDSVDRRPAYAVVADALRARILAGDLTPGTRLPVDADLRAEFGVGQSTVREAIRTLASENLVRTVRGAAGGTFVSQPSLQHIEAHVEAGVTLLTSAEAVSIDQLMEVRQLTEVPATGAAAYRRTDQHLADLRAAMYEPTTEVSDEIHIAHQDFHRIVLHAAGNPLLDLVTVPVFTVLSSRFARDMAPRGVWPKIDADHIGIYEAIEARDSITAMNLMRRHLDQLGDIYRQMDLLRKPN